MHILTIVITVVLAVVLAGAGAPKVLNLGSAQKNAEHLGVAPTLNRVIGVLELAATAGLLVGLAVRPLAVAAAAGVCLLMVGALVSHSRAHDPAPAMIPALGVGVLAGGVLVLQLVF